MRARLLLLFAVLSACGCTTVSRCKANTLLLSLTLEGDVALADALAVAVSRDGGMPVVNPPQPHQSGARTGTLEIDFNSVYHVGSSVVVDVKLLKNGVEVARQKTTPVALTLGCTTAVLTIAAVATTPPDGADLAGSSATDGAAAGPGADLACAGPEDCFNGIDDDCNGHIDCDDDACKPVATCMPGAFGATYVSIPGGANPTCAAGTTAQTLWGDFNRGNQCVGCSSTWSGVPTVTVFSTSFFCPNNGSVAAVSGFGAKSAAFPVPGASQPVLWPTGLTCSAPIGTPSPVPITTRSYCAAPSTGGGCPSGNVCVPKIAASDAACILVDTATACSATAYKDVVAPGSDDWATDKADNRACPAVCPSNANAPETYVSVCPASGCRPTDTYDYIQTGACTRPVSISASGSYTVQIDSGPFEARCQVSLPPPSTGAITAAGSRKHLCCTH
jgi:hypothetical protein